MMSQGKNVLTTGEVAKLCSVAPRTVSKWFDSGQLRGYRIPGSKDRRIPVDQLIRFMRAHGMPLNGLDAGVTRVLVLDADDHLCRALQGALEAGGEYEVRSAATAIEAGAFVYELKPHVVIVDVTLPDAPPRTISRFIRSVPDLAGARLIGVAPGMDTPRGQSLLQSGFDAYLSKPFEIRTLIRLIEERSGGAVSSEG